MTDIRHDDPSLEGQIGYRGPAFIAHLFSADTTQNQPETENDQ
jgi:hypothetical protein